MYSVFKYHSIWECFQKPWWRIFKLSSCHTLCLMCLWWAYSSTVAWQGKRQFAKLKSHQTFVVNGIKNDHWCIKQVGERKFGEFTEQPITSNIKVGKLKLYSCWWFFQEKHLLSWELIMSQHITCHSINLNDIMLWHLLLWSASEN